jgi:hypothetical protein
VPEVPARDDEEKIVTTPETTEMTAPTPAQIEKELQAMARAYRALAPLPRKMQKHALRWLECRLRQDHIKRLEAEATAPPETPR